MAVSMRSSKSILETAKSVARDAQRDEIMAKEDRARQARIQATGLTPENISEAWSLLSPAGHSVLTKGQVLDNLKTLMPHVSAKDVRELVGTGNMSVDKLTNLLLHTDVQLADPNIEAFKLLDPTSSGSVDPAVIKKMLLQLHGVDQIDDADMQLIMQLCDADKDGRISYKDFATIGSWAPVKEVPNDFTRKLMLEKLREAQGIRRDDD